MTTVIAAPAAESTSQGFDPDEPTYEIIRGRRVELPPMSAYATRVANRIANQINAFAMERELGEAVVEVLFRLPVAGNIRRPDVAFVTKERWPQTRPMPTSGNAWDVVPDLAVEVISPSDLAEELIAKIEEYFRSGVRLVWVVYPVLQLVHVYESLTTIRGITADGAMVGGAVLPDFRVSLANLFPASPPPSV